MRQVAKAATGQMAQIWPKHKATARNSLNTRQQTDKRSVLNHKQKKKALQDKARAA
jgi:hypothetical protein